MGDWVWIVAGAAVWLGLAAPVAVGLGRAVRIADANRPILDPEQDPAEDAEVRP